MEPHGIDMASLIGGMQIFSYIFWSATTMLNEEWPPCHVDVTEDHLHVPTVSTAGVLNQSRPPCNPPVKTRPDLDIQAAIEVSCARTSMPNPVCDNVFSQVPSFATVAKALDSIDIPKSKRKNVKTFEEQAVTGTHMHAP